MTEQLRVGSFNIRTSRARDGNDGWRRRRDACLAAIGELEADVVGLQEVRPDQLADLRNAFPGARIEGVGRDQNGGGEHASVLVAPGGWTVESSETRWLSPAPRRPGSRGWDAGLARVVTLVRLRLGATRLGVANTHFDHVGTMARERSAALIAEWLGQEPDRAWVVLGDLNDQPGSRPLRLLAEAGYTDALGPDDGGTEHAFSGATDRTRIDYVLVGRGVQVRAAWINHNRPQGRLPSDHWPVLADLTVG